MTVSTQDGRRHSTSTPTRRCCSRCFAILAKHGLATSGALDLRQHPQARAEVMALLESKGHDVQPGAPGVAAAAPRREGGPRPSASRSCASSRRRASSPRPSTSPSGSRSSPSSSYVHSYVITYRRVVGTRIRTPARGNGPLAARPGRSQRGLGADALPGRAGRDQPDADGGRADRRRTRALAVPAAAPRRGRTRSRWCARPSAGRAGSARGHRYGIVTPPHPGQRAEVSEHVLPAGAATGGPDDPPIHEAGRA